jgi:hypothetical protein
MIGDKIYIYIQRFVSKDCGTVLVRMRSSQEMGCDQWLGKRFGL